MTRLYNIAPRRPSDRRSGDLWLRFEGALAAWRSAALFMTTPSTGELLAKTIIRRSMRTEGRRGTM